MLDYQKKTGLENTCSYLPQVNPGYLSNSFDKFVKNTALVSEKYSDMIFSCSVDQLSYFKNPTKPFIYLYPDERIIRNDKKFINLDKIKIVHAPSSPIIKGTPLVRAAIKKLELDGYCFDYVELIGASNEQVLEELRSAHIVLNQFYAFMPGIFAIEAMASHCALLTSADETIEWDLPSGSNNAWVVTKYYEIYEKLKHLMDNKDLIKPQADSGLDWVREHAAFSRSGKKLQEMLNSI